MRYYVNQQISIDSDAPLMDIYAATEAISAGQDVVVSLSSEAIRLLLATGVPRGEAVPLVYTAISGGKHKGF